MRIRKANSARRTDTAAATRPGPKPKYQEVRKTAAMNGRNRLGSRTCRNSTDISRAAAGNAIAEGYRREEDCGRIMPIPLGKVYYTVSCKLFPLTCGFIQRSLAGRPRFPAAVYPKPLIGILANDAFEDRL